MVKRHNNFVLFKALPKTAGCLVILLSCLLTACNREPLYPTKVLNSKHQLVIEACDIQYNGKPLMLNDTITKWVEVLGPYDRKVRLANDIYVWDDIGLQVYSRWDKERALSINFMFNHEKTGYEEGLELSNKPEHKKDLAELIDSRPKRFFRDALRLDGVLMDQFVDFEAVNRERLRYAQEHKDWQPGQEIKYFQESYTPVRYAYERICPDGQRYGFLIMLLSPQQPHRIGTFTIGGPEPQ